MICYQDRLYCVTPGCQCERALTDEVKAAARRWWGSDNPPIAVAYLHGGEPVEIQQQQAEGGGE